MIAQHIARRPHPHPIIDLSQTVSGIAYLNSLDAVARPSKILKITGIDVRELRQILEARIQKRSLDLKLSQDMMRNATH